MSRHAAKFTNRNDCLMLVKAAVDHLQQGQPEVLHFFGPSGIGKSALRRHIYSNLVDKHRTTIDVVVLDFDESSMRTPHVALSRMRNALSNLGVLFPLFDIANRWFQRRTGYDSVGTDKIDDGSTLDDFISAVEIIPVLDITARIARAFQLISKVNDARYKWAQQEWALNLLKEEIGELSLADPWEIADRLPSLFGRDLTAWSKNNRRHVAILLDTMESIGWRFHDTQTAAFAGDAWLLELIRSSTSTLYITFGRHQLPWTAVASDAARVVIQKEVVPFLPRDINRYFDDNHIMSKDDRQAISDLARGYPLGLDLGVDWVRRRDSDAKQDSEGGREVKVHRTRREQLMSRFTRYLRPDELEALKTIACLRIFDREVLEYIHVRLEMHAQPDLFSRVIDLQGVEEVTGGRYHALHQLLRRVIVSAEGDTEEGWHKRIHSVAFEFYSEKLASLQSPLQLVSSGLQYAEEGIFHGVMSSSKDDLADVILRISRFATNGGMRTWWLGQAQWIMSQEAASELVVAMVQTRLASSPVLSRSTRLEYSASSLAVLERIAPSSRFLGHALAVRAVLHLRSDLQEASTLVERARDIAASIESPDLFVSVYNISGLIARKLGDTSRRRDNYLKALAVAEEHSIDLHRIEEIRNNVASVMRFDGHLNQAYDLFVTALANRVRYGGPESTGVPLGHISQILLEQGRSLEALKYAVESLRVHRVRGNKGSIVIAQRRRIECLLQLGRLDEAWDVVEESRSELHQEDANIAWHVAVAELAVASDRIDEAKSHISEALPGATSVSARNKVIATQGYILLKSSPEMAIECLEESLSLSIQSRDVIRFTRTAGHLSDALVRTGVVASGLALARAQFGLSVWMGHNLQRAALERVLDSQADLANGDPYVLSRPSDHHIALDKRYADLAARTPTGRYMKPIDIQEIRTGVINGDVGAIERLEDLSYESPPVYPEDEWVDLLLDLDNNDPLDRLYIHLVSSQLSSIAVVKTHDPSVISAVSRVRYGSPSQELIDSARRALADDLNGEESGRDTRPPLGAEEASLVVQSELERFGFPWTVVVKADMLARMAVAPRRKQVSIRDGASFSVDELHRLLAHEISGHVLRSVNGNEQMLSVFATGLPGYLETEEGLAIWLESQGAPPHPSTMRRIALRVLAASWAETMSFSEVFSKCCDTCGDRSLSFDVSIRSKRGFSNAESLGAHTKDIVYLQGFNRISQLLSGSQRTDLLSTLYVGKIGVQHLDMVKAGLSSGWIRPPILIPELG